METTRKTDAMTHAHMPVASEANAIPSQPQDDRELSQSTEDDTARRMREIVTRVVTPNMGNVAVGIQASLDVRY